MGSSHTDFAALDAAVEKALSDGDYGLILGLIVANLSESDGAPHMLRYVGDALETLDRAEDAVDLYQETVEYAVDTNRPLDAILAVKALAQLSEDAPVDELKRLIAETFSVGSSKLETGTTPTGVPIDGAVLVEPIGEDVPIDVLAENAVLACQAVTTADRKSTPASPIPLLSDLGVEDFTCLMDALQPRTYTDGEKLVVSDEVLPGIWWLVFGGLTVVQEDSGNRALTGPNLVIGLEALFGGQSEVTIDSLGRSDTLFLPKEQLAALMNDRPTLREQIRHAVSRYEIHQAISRCELFRQLPVSEHAHFLTAFTGYRVPADQVLVSQGSHSPGLFIITHGEVELRARAGEDTEIIETLGPGGLFCLQGIDNDESMPFTAVTTVNTRALFLDNDALKDALDQHPAVASILRELRLTQSAVLALD